MTSAWDLFMSYWETYLPVFILSLVPFRKHDEIYNTRGIMNSPPRIACQHYHRCCLTWIAPWTCPRYPAYPRVPLNTAKVAILSASIPRKAAWSLVWLRDTLQTRETWACPWRWNDLLCHKYSRDLKWINGRQRRRRRLMTLTKECETCRRR